MFEKPAPMVIILRGLFGSCPHCGKGRIFNGLYAVNEYCAHCHLPMNDRPGDFTGAAYLNTGLTGFIVIMFGIAAVLLTDISILALSAIAIPMIIVLATLFHRPIRGGWVALMYYSEAITPPDN